MDLINFEKMFNKLFGSTQDSILSALKNYSNLLDRDLELWMFVPCDSKGNFITEPIKSQNQCGMQDWQQQYDEYIEAKNKVIFKDFKYVFNNAGDSIEYRSTKRSVRELKHYKIRNLVDLGIKLTDTAVKELDITVLN